MSRLIKWILLLAMATVSLFAQGVKRPGGGAITGKIYDSETGRAIEYANIVLINSADSSQVTGTISDKTGAFTLKNIPPGRYAIEVYFLGYETKTFKSIHITRANPRVELGRVVLEPKVLTAETVEVEGERAAISYQIDKKVIDVDQQLTATSGTAVDVLENVPSVTVDIEGNVSMRGSSNFRVLIDGRPTVMEASEALKQIAANNIKTIEIITNPSAKYDPEGAAGIINIILKKARQPGHSGMANVSAGINDKYGGEAILEIKEPKYNTTFSVDYDNRTYTGDDLERRWTENDGITSYINSDGTSSRERHRYGLRGSFEYDLTDSDILGLNGRYGNYSSLRDARDRFDQWTETDNDHTIYSSVTDREREGAYYALSASYQHKFENEGHELTADAHYHYHDGDEETVNELRPEKSESIINGQKTIEYGPGRGLRIKSDYVYPIAEHTKFEAGLNGDLDRSEEGSGLYEYSTEEERYVWQRQFAYLTDYRRDIYAAYTMYSSEWNNFGYQLGLRGEYTGRAIELSSDGRRFTIDRWDYFPTLHTSYQFSKGQQMMLSYTRRIDRPRGWHLEPFQTWMDAYNVRQGNPDLKPEYIDSYELGFQTHFSRNLFSIEAYYRVNQNKIERVRSVYEPNVTLHTLENIGRDFSFGSEMQLNMSLMGMWDLNLMSNLYHYRVEGSLNERSFARESFNWGARVNNNFKFGDVVKLQLDGNYRSPTVSSQGRREGFLYISAAMRYELIKNQLSAILQVRDVFGTARYEYTSEGPDFYSYNKYDRESPIVMLNLRFNFNNYKPERRRENGDAGGMREDDF